MYLFALICVAVLSVNSNEIKKSSITPYDLEAEIREQLEELENIVRGNIFGAFNSLDGMIREVYDVRNEALSTAEIAIRQENDILLNQITTIKDLAQASGADIEVCLVNSLPILNELPTTIINSLMECLAFANKELTIINNDSRYRITTLMNEVNVFEFQLDLCAGDFLCMAPLVTEIQLAKINIPQKIGVELDNANDLFNNLKVNIKQCTDGKVAQFNAEGGNILADITECANNIMS